MCKNGILRVKREQEFTSAKDFMDKRRFTEWWRYQYVHRHVTRMLAISKTLRRNRVATFEWLEMIANKYEVIKNTQDLTPTEYTARLVEMSNCLVYSYHKRNQVGAEVNLIYENWVAAYGFLFDRLQSDEIVTVKIMHELTMQFGFLVVPLFLGLNKATSWEAFVKKDGNGLRELEKSMLFPYPRYHLKDSGIEIIYPNYQFEVKDNWDMAIYYDDDLTNEDLKKWVNTNWKENSLVEIGNRTTCKFKMYINRDRCSRRYVFKYLKAGIIGLKTLNCRGFFPLMDEERPRGKAVKREKRSLNKADIKKIIGLEYKLVHTKTQYKKIEQRRRKLNRENQQYIDAQELIDEDLNQYLSPQQNNVRRAIGLRIWDRVTESLAEKLAQEVSSKDRQISAAKQTETIKRNRIVGKVISSMIKELADEHPKLLELYRRDWNSGDASASGSTIMNTLKKRMRRDYQMTEYCISNKGYFSNYQSIKGT